jgi:tetratricopeptide (TPR) repeat protein
MIENFIITVTNNFAAFDSSDNKEISASSSIDEIDDLDKIDVMYERIDNLVCALSDPMKTRRKYSADMSIRELGDVISRVGIQDRTVGMIEKQEYVDLIDNFYLDIDRSSEFDLELWEEEADRMGAMGKIADMKALYERKVIAYERRLGVDSVNTSVVLNNYGMTLKQIGSKECLHDALPLLSHALAKNIISLGYPHINTLRTINNLAECLFLLDRNDDAKVLFESCLFAATTVELTLRKESRDVQDQSVIALNFLAGLSEREYKFDEAIDYWNRCVDLSSSISGPNGANTMRLCQGRERCQYLKSRHNQAKEKKEGPKVDHPKVMLSQTLSSSTADIVASATSLPSQWSCLLCHAPNEGNAVTCSICKRSRGLTDKDIDDVVSTDAPSSSSNFEKRGVSLRLLQSVRDFALSCNDSEEYWTIGRLSALIIGNHEILGVNNRWGVSSDQVDATLTYRTRSSLVEMLLGVSYFDAVAEKAIVFLSFAYSANYIELVDALEVWVADDTDKIDSVYFWFDVFVNDQVY